MTVEGFVRKTDLFGDTPYIPEDALLMTTGSSIFIPVYDLDGQVIDQFEIFA